MMNRLLDRLRRGDAKNARLLLPLEKVGASQGKYQGADEPALVHLHIDTTEGDRLTLEMTPRQAATAIEQLMATYRAINPELRIRNYGGW